jgi:PIN domain
MDVILDANAYIHVLHKHGRRFLETNQFVELLTYLRRTSSRLVIPELTYNEVVARYGERLVAVAKAARDAWYTLQQVGMEQRSDFLEPDIKSGLATLGDLLHHPVQGVQAVMYTDYSGADVKEVVRRGIGRVRPANDEGEELRDVILWLVVLHYAKQAKTHIAFVSDDKTLKHTDGTLHPTLLRDIREAGVSIAFYRSVGEFVKGNALESEPLDDASIAAYVSAEELRGIATEQLLGSRFWIGTIVGAEVVRYELAEAQRYRVAEDSYYIESRYTGEGAIRIARQAAVSIQTKLSEDAVIAQVTTAVLPRPTVSDTTFIEGPLSLLRYNELFQASPELVYSSALGVPWVPETTENSYRCNFSIRVSLRITGDTRESLEVESFVLLGELVPITTGSA